MIKKGRGRGDRLRRLLVSERTLVPAFMPLAPATTRPARIADQVGEVLAAHREPDSVIQPEAERMRQWRIDGCDQGNARGLLAGFLEWLVLQVGCGDNPVWLEPGPAPCLHGGQPPGDLPTDVDAKAKQTLFRLLDEFLELAAEHDGLHRVYATYHAWRTERAEHGCDLRGFDRGRDAKARRHRMCAASYSSSRICRRAGDCGSELPIKVAFLCRSADTAVDVAVDAHALIG